MLFNIHASKPPCQIQHAELQNNVIHTIYLDGQSFLSLFKRKIQLVRVLDKESSELKELGRLDFGINSKVFRLQAINIVIINWLRELGQRKKRNITWTVCLGFTPKLSIQARARGSSWSVGAKVVGSIVTWNQESWTQFKSHACMSGTSFRFSSSIESLITIIIITFIIIMIIIITFKVIRQVRYFLLSPTTITLLTTCRKFDFQISLCLLIWAHETLLVNIYLCW